MKTPTTKSDTKKNIKQEKQREVLVALLKEVSDFATLETEGWYRIPIERKPKHWSQKWIAFFQPKVFKKEAYRIQYYGRVSKIDIVERKILYPKEFENPKSEKLYLRIQLETLIKREQPIVSLIPRRLIFVPTTWEKFSTAEFINDIFDDSPLEDELWRILKRETIAAERQWEVKIRDRFYYLDFAIFCKNGQLAVEVDGDTFHRATKEQIDYDLKRNNQLEFAHWRPLHFSPRQIQESQGKYAVQEIKYNIKDLGGLDSDGLVPRIFYPESNAQQLTLFENQAEYNIEEDYPDLD